MSCESREAADASRRQQAQDPDTKQSCYKKNEPNVRLKTENSSQVSN